MWTENTIAKMLRENDRAVERAMVAIYDRQTQDEKQTSNTRHLNARGFRANHASKGSYYARWVLGGRHLTGHHLANARKIALHYRRQLAEIANDKQAKLVAGALDRTGLSETAYKSVDFEARVQDYMRRTGEPRANAVRVVTNVMAGRCPDGCCGGES